MEWALARAATSRLKVNAPLGSPPTLEWRAVGELLIDPVYQRSIDTGPSQSLIRKIAMFWDWGLCQPLAVSRRPDGQLTIVDGQHRASAAKLRGDIPHLPCVITSYANAGDEAAAFVALNQMRRPLSALDLFKAAVAAEDTEALLILDCLTSAGLSVASHSNYTAWKVGQVANVGGLRRVMVNRGEPTLRLALLALAKSYPGEVLRYAGTLFPGFAAVVIDELRLRSSGDEIIAQLVPLIAAKTQDEWRHIIKAAVGESGGMAREGAELVFRRVWRSRNMASPPALLGQTSVSAAATAWCQQCDQRVSGVKAARCTSPFCKLKAKAA
jgi:hypothetical protein